MQLMQQDESTLQELAARLAREEQVHADLLEKLANAQTGLLGQQVLAPESLSRNQPTETASDTPPPQVPGAPLRSGHRLFSTRRQVFLLALLVVLIIGCTVGAIFGYHALRTRLSPASPAV